MTDNKLDFLKTPGKRKTLAVAGSAAPERDPAAYGVAFRKYFD
jgi:hypothetical protein